MKNDVTSKIKKAINRSEREWKKTAPKKLIKDVKSYIVKGVSPVKGKGHFDKYSDSYQDAIKKGRYKQYNKKIRPINMTLSGKMMRSLIRRFTKNGFIIYFTSELAKYHNILGAGRSRTIRRILPLKGETFKGPIIKRQKTLLEKILKKHLRR